MWNCVTDNIKAEMSMDTGMSRFILLSAALHLGALAVPGYGPVRPAQLLPSTLSVTLDAPSGMTAAAVHHSVAPPASAVSSVRTSSSGVKPPTPPKLAKLSPQTRLQNVPTPAMTQAHADSHANDRVNELDGDSVSPPPEQSHEDPPAAVEAHDDVAQQPAVSYIQPIDLATLTTRLAGQLRDALAPYFAYPMMARRHGWQGQVRVGLRVEADGHLSHVRIAHSSGYRLLDSAALATLNHINTVPQAAGWLEGRHFDMVLPIDYRLIDGQS
jgi:protein TonB